MQYFEHLFKLLPQFLSSLLIIVAVFATIWGANWILLRRARDLGEERRFPRRVAIMFITVVGIVVILLALPVAEGTKDQLVALVGLVTTAAIALASTTFVANAMAGFMLRTASSFRPGDFVHVAEHFGRVTERGLFHTEIQTEDSDLVTLPNLFLVTHPVKVVCATGTIVSARVSLGYDLPHQEIRSLLLAAAEAADLKGPFVQIEDLGDFSISYRVAGFLSEVKQLLTARSMLRSQMLDKLHGAGVEIVSPTYMNQRQLKVDQPAIPPAIPETAKVVEGDDDVPEELIFDKAEEAARVEKLQEERAALIEEIAELKKMLGKAGESERARLDQKIQLSQSRSDAIGKELKD